MKTTCRGQWVFVAAVAAAALSLSAGRATGADDSYYGLPLTQVRFDRLIPMSFPTTSPSYDRLRHTTSPLIDPGVATIPTASNLVHPTDQPLLIMSEGLGQGARIPAKSESAPVIQRGSELSRLPQRSGESSAPK